MDVLTDVLKTAGLTIQIGDVIARESSFRLERRFGGGLVFYAATEGTCRLGFGRSAMELASGEVAFVNHEVAHTLEGYEIIPVRVVTGQVTFSAGFQGAKFLHLPPVLKLPTAGRVELATMFEQLVSEVTDARPGWELVCEGKAKSLFIQALRVHGSEAENGAHGWLRGLADNEIGQALRKMHEQPSHPWTVATLAQSLSMSRSAFAARFKDVTGRPPLDYLTWWRLHRAAVRLRDRDGATIAMVARDAGYDSDASFGKAFRREFGTSPGKVRREALVGSSSPLQFELKKQTPFSVPEQETSLNLTKTAWHIQAEFRVLFEQYELTGAEYNVLRILRGAGEPLVQAEILSRLVIPNSEPKELFARLKKRLLVRYQKAEDSFVITDEGRALLDEIDTPLIDLHRRHLAHFSPGEVAELNRLLVKARRPDH